MKGMEQRWPALPVSVLPMPASAVIGTDDANQVFVTGSDGIASLRWVSTGNKLNGVVEVPGGLVSGETVVVAPTSGLREGRRIFTVTHTQDRAKEALY